MPPTDGAGLVRWALRQERRRIVVGALTGIVWMGGLALIPVVVGRAIDGAVDDGSGAEIGRWAAIVALIVVVSAAAGAIRHRIAMLLFANTGWRVEQELTRRIHDPRGGAARAPGDSLAMATTDAERIGGIADLMCRGSGAIVTFVGIGALMILTSPLLGIIVLVGLPATLFALVPLWPRAERRAAEQRAQLAAATSTATDTIAGLRTVRGLGAEQVARSWFASSSAAVERAGVDMARVLGAWFALSAAVPSLFLALVLWVGGNLAIDGDLTPGEVVAFTGLATFLTIPLQTISELAVTWAAGLASARQIGAALATPPAVDESSDAASSGDAGGLALVGVSTDGLEGLDLTVGADEVLGVACDDQSSALALAELLARRRDPDDGYVTLGGTDLRSLPLSELRSRILVDDAGDPWIRSGTVAQNLSLGGGERSAVGEREHLDALHRAAMTELLEEPSPLSVRIGGRGLRLSGGQRQRLAIARAIRRDPPALVLADPTSALDALTEAEVSRSLVATRRGRCTVLATTSPTLLAACDRVALIADRRCVDSGHHAELLARRPEYAALIGVTP
ncbi:MAG: ABC transporter ATP-binding protein [Actinomycetota bacterium]